MESKKPECLEDIEAPSIENDSDARQTLVQEIKTLQETLESIKTKHPNEIRDVAKAWAFYCIEHMDGQLLQKGLNISAAITEYAFELEHENGR